MASFELEADVDEKGNALAFYYSTGGPHEMLLPEEEDPIVVHGPFTWSEILEQQLRPVAWLERVPIFVHRAVAARIRAELEHASEPTLARWEAVLAKVAT